jgi:lysophospholipase L1-like esterase
MSGKNLSTVFPNLETQNLAVSGSTSFEHYEVIKSLQSQPQDVLGIVVMTTGGNDLIHNYGQMPPEEGAMYGASYTQAKPWIDNFELRLDEMLTHLRKIFPGGCQIFLANIYDPSDGTGNTGAWLTGLPAWPDAERILLAYNATLSKFAAKYKYVHLVDIHKPFLGHGIHCRKFWIKHYRRDDPTYWFYLNIEDPSERGYDAIRRVFLIEMAKVFIEENAFAETKQTLHSNY